MTLQTALMSAIGALVSVILFLAGVIGYLWRELRNESRARAKDSTLFLNTLEHTRSKYSARAADHHQLTPSETPTRPELPYSVTLGRKTNRTRD